MSTNPFAKQNTTGAGDDDTAQHAAENASPVDIDSLLNQDLNSIPDLPDFIVPREGAYMAHVDSVDLAKEIGDSTAFEIAYTIGELLEERGTTTGDAVKPGDKFSELYFMTTQKGAAYTVQHLKKLLAPVAERMGSTDLRTTLMSFAGCDVAIMIKHQKDREDKNKVYAKVAKVMFAD